MTKHIYQGYSMCHAMVSTIECDVTRVVSDPVILWILNNQCLKSSVIQLLVIHYNNVYFLQYKAYNYSAKSSRPSHGVSFKQHNNFVNDNNTWSLPYVIASCQSPVFRRAFTLIAAWQRVDYYYGKATTSHRIMNSLGYADILKLIFAYLVLLPQIIATSKLIQVNPHCVNLGP